MIPVYLFFDGIKNSLEYKITKYVNDNLKVMIEVYIDYLNANDDFDIKEKLMEVLPRDYVINKTEECRRLVDELYEIISSSTIRDYIKPKYEYILYHIMYTWMEICDDDEVKYIPIKLSDELRDEICSCEDYISEDGVNIIIEELEDFNSYMSFCFYDHDFLPESLEAMVIGYLRSPAIFETVFADVDLDDYVDLMPVDLRDLYLDKQKKNMSLQEGSLQKNDIERDVIIELYSAISLLQNNSVELIDKSEVEISNEIYRMTKRLFKKSFNLEIEREAQIGQAKVNLGETDFAIYVNDRYYQNISIVENKFIERFLDQYGQLLGYLNTSFKFGVTLSINKNKTMDVATEYITEKLKSINDKDFEIVNIVRNPFGNEFDYIIKSEHTLPEDKNKTMNIYHLILNIYDVYRKKIAEQSRK